MRLVEETCTSPTVQQEPGERRGGYDPSFFEDLYAAEDRHFWFRARNRVIAALARELTKDLPPGHHLLEAGCGNGMVTRALQQACPRARVIGADLFGDGLRYARKRGVLRLVQTDIVHSPFRQIFDMVGMFDVLEHIPDDLGTLRCIHQALRPGGRLMLTVPAHQTLWSYFDEAAHHCRRYELPELIAKCNDCGYDVEYATEFMVSIYPLVRLQRWWAGKQQAVTPVDSDELARRELAIPAVLNTLLDWLTRIETAVVRRRKRLAYGTSLLLIARRRETG
jgi:SAM-dependent methyltransferase